MNDCSLASQQNSETRSVRSLWKMSRCDHLTAQYVHNLAAHLTDFAGFPAISDGGVGGVDFVPLLRFFGFNPMCAKFSFGREPHQRYLHATD